VCSLLQIKKKNEQSNLEFQGMKRKEKRNGKRKELDIVTLTLCFQQDGTAFVCERTNATPIPPNAIGKNESSTRRTPYTYTSTTNHHTNKE